MSVTKLLLSPRISALKSDLESGNIGTLVAFWQEMAKQGTPLIEPIPDDKTHMLVTFLWRTKENLQNVVVIGGPAGEDVASGQMTRLLNSDLWHKSYRVRSDVRTTYFFSPNDPLIRMVLAGHIEANSEMMPGKPIIKGTRVPVELILRKLSEGANVGELL